MGQKKVTLFISEVEMHARVVLGVGKESFLERCPHREREVPLYLCHEATE